MLYQPITDPSFHRRAHPPCMISLEISAFAILKSPFTLMPLSKINNSSSGGAWRMGSPTNLNWTGKLLQDRTHPLQTSPSFPGRHLRTPFSLGLHLILSVFAFNTFLFALPPFAISHASPYCACKAPAIPVSALQQTMLHHLWSYSAHQRPSFARSLPSSIPLSCSSTSYGRR